MAFQKPSPHSDQSYTKISTLIQKQQQHITELLNKYELKDQKRRDSLQTDEFYLYPFQRLIEHRNSHDNRQIKTIKHRNQSKSKIRTSQQIQTNQRKNTRERYSTLIKKHYNQQLLIMHQERIGILLPIIEAKKNLRESRNIKKLHQSSLEMQDKISNNNYYKKSKLRKAYGGHLRQQKDHVENSLKYSIKYSPKMSDRKRNPISKSNLSRPLQETFHQGHFQFPTSHLRQSSCLSKNISPTVVYQPLTSSDEQQQANNPQQSTAHYHKLFTETMRTQCLEQLNLLYFTKNQSMKSWTQSLLTLFEKHDKEIVEFRKKCKFLGKFQWQVFRYGGFEE